MRPATVSGEKETLKKFVDKAVIVQHWSHDSSNLYFLCLAYQNPDSVLGSAQADAMDDDDFADFLDDDTDGADMIKDDYVLKMDLYYMIISKKSIRKKNLTIAIPHESKLYPVFCDRHLIFIHDLKLIHLLKNCGAAMISVAGI